MERRPTVTGAPSDSYAYSGYGSLSIGEEKWKVFAKFEPEYPTAWLRVLPIQLESSIVFIQSVTIQILSFFANDIVCDIVYVAGQNLLCAG